MSDYSNLTKSIGSTPAQDVKFDDVATFIQQTDLSGIQQELLEDYGISITTEQVLFYINDLDIDISFNDYRACDIIYEQVFNQNSIS